MTAEAYRQSAIIARDHGGPFAEYRKNEEPFLRVIEKHRDAAHGIPDKQPSRRTCTAPPATSGTRPSTLGQAHGYRNAQTTLLAPTGTIAFMMDCDTTGIEPDIALVKYKKLVGEGFLKIVNQTVPGALRKLGYTPEQVDAIVAYVNERETIEGAPELKPEHLSVFDCAFKPMNGTRSIHYMGHLRMMSAVQPFLSGAISKTVNMPENATPDEIETVYLEGWRMGLKAIAIYRDNCKRSQPLNTGKKKEGATTAEIAAATAVLAAAGVAALGAAPAAEPKPYRRRLPAERTAITHKFDIAGHEGYITVGLYPDGQPGEIFLKMAKEGSHHQRPDGHLRDHGQRRPAVRRAAPRPGPQVRPRPVRAVGLHRQPGDPDREIDRGLHLPLDGLQFLPAGRPRQARLSRPVGDRGIFCPASQPGLGGDAGASSAGTSGSGSVSRRCAGFTAEWRTAVAAPEAATGAGEADAKVNAGGVDSRSEATPISGNGHGPAAAGLNGNGNGNGTNGKPRATLGSLGIGRGQVTFAAQADAPSCAECGSIMVRNGSCYKCLNCGSTSGCS